MKELFESSYLSVMSEENDKLRKEIERLTAESTKWESKFYDEAKKVDKAIEYIENETTYSDYKEMDTLINILRGDKE